MKVTNWFAALLLVVFASACNTASPTSIEVDEVASPTSSEATIENDTSTDAGTLPSSPRAINKTTGMVLEGPLEGPGEQQMCTEETCPGTGGGGGSNGGIQLSGLTWDTCTYSPTVSGIDADEDNVDDECEFQLAQSFAPKLAFHTGETNSHRNTFWAAHWKYSCADAGGYPPQCLTVLPVIRIGYFLGYAADYGYPLVGTDHQGDSEFLIVDVAYVEAEDRWKVSRVFMSAHWHTNESESQWYYWDELQWGTSVPYAQPLVYVAKDKHSNYVSASRCNNGGATFFIGGDDCSDNSDIENIVIYRHRNIGESGADSGNHVRFVDCTTLGTIYEECFWTEKVFRGWQNFSGSSAGPYEDVLRVFMWYWFAGDYTPI